MAEHQEGIVLTTVDALFNALRVVIGKNTYPLELVEVAYYNRERLYRTLGLQTSENRSKPTTGPIRSRPVLNGLHHVYERAA